jgi:tRNA uridine 5-carbamoylmethylation protein Kti12
MEIGAEKNGKYLQSLNGQELNWNILVISAMKNYLSSLKYCVCEEMLKLKKKHAISYFKAELRWVLWFWV